MYELYDTDYINKMTEEYIQLQDENEQLRCELSRMNDTLSMLKQCNINELKVSLKDIREFEENKPNIKITYTETPIGEYIIKW